MGLKIFMAAAFFLLSALSLAYAAQPARFSLEDRAFLTAFMKDEYERRCPGKMATLRKGCRLPASGAIYTLGAALPETTMTFPLPPALQEKISPPPPGHIHLQAGKDILMLRQADKVVTDAVVLRDALATK